MKYDVDVTVEFDTCYTVEAESEEQAKEIAEQMAMKDQFEDIPSGANAWNVVEITPEVEKKQIDDYFQKCKRFWMNQGDSESVATSKAFWWDCVEIWNADKSWTPVKEKFAMEFWAHKLGDPVPDSEVVAKGGV